MHRTEGTNYDDATGVHLFANGPPGTTVEQNILNALQEEICRVITDSGQTLKVASTDTWDQLSLATRSLSGIRMLAKTGNYTMTPADLYGNTIINNTGAAGEVIITLPAGVLNYGCYGYITVNQYLRFAAQAGETFRYRSVQSAAGGYIRTNIVGNMVSIAWTGSDWMCSFLGSWNYDF